jgi:hypothetical protein
MFDFLRDQERIEDIKSVNFARALLMYLLMLSVADPVRSYVLIVRA